MALPTSNWINWLRSGSQLIAGMKITAAFLSYLSVGQIGKWLFEVFYPFTRLLWSDFLSWLDFPDISDIEKDALTAALFFLPLGVSAVFSHLFRNEKDELSKSDLQSDRRTAIICGFVFFFIICGGLLSSVAGTSS